MKLRFDFASDNTAGVAPEALAAIQEMNGGFAAGYGTDEVSVQAADLVRGLLDADVDVYFVTTGTAANAICLAALCAPFDAVLAHEHAHILIDELSAPAAFGRGLALRGLPGSSAKISPQVLQGALWSADKAHHQRPSTLSVSNATEYGAVYSNVELERLFGIAKAGQCLIHLDGARLANAAAAGLDVKRLVPAGADLLVLGGAKSGMPCTEAIVVASKSLRARFGARLKQAGQLPSKGRFCAAPWIGMLRSGAWLRWAAHSNAMARRLAAALPLKPAHPVEANAVFIAMDETMHERLRELGWIVFRASDSTVRFMCSWATTAESVDEIAAVIKSIT